MALRATGQHLPLRAVSTCPTLGNHPSTGGMLMRSSSFSFDNKENVSPNRAEDFGTAMSTRTPVGSPLRYASITSYDYNDDYPINLYPGPVKVHNHFEWRVEAILAVRAGGDDPEFLVKWLGWPFNASTWEPLANLTNCQEALRDFFETLEEQRFKSKFTA